MVPAAISVSGLPRWGLSGTSIKPQHNVSQVLLSALTLLPGMAAIGHSLLEIFARFSGVRL